MARYIEVTAADGTIARTRIDPAVNRFSVRPGDAFRIIDDNGNVPPGVVVKRYDNHLIISGIDEGGQTQATQVELLNFYGVCSVANPCRVEVKEAEGSTAPVVVTSSTEPIAAQADGAFILYDPNRPSIPDSASPTAAPTEIGSDPSTSTLVWAGVGVGVVALALAGGGGGGGGTPAAVSPSPAAPNPTPSPAPTPPPPGPPPDTVPPNPPVISPIGGDGRVTLAEKAAGLTIAGTGEAGAIVTVSIDGVERTGLVDAAGNWQVRFDPAQVGSEGSHAALVTLTDAAGNRSAQVNPSYTVATVSTILTVGGDGPPNTINAAERAAGFTVQGLGPEGSPAATPVNVTLSAGGRSASYTVPTDANGNWVAPFTAADNLPDGTYTVNAFGTIGGVAGAAATRSALVDATPPGAPAVLPVTGDNIVGPIEIAAGVVIAGRAEAGSSVAVAINNAPLAVVVEADGDWTAAVPAPLLPSMGFPLITARATDAVGNSGPPAQVTLTVVALSPAGVDSRVTTQALQAEQLFSDPGLSSTAATPSASSLASTVSASPLGALIDDPNQANLA